MARDKTFVRHGRRATYKTKAYVSENQGLVVGGLRLTLQKTNA